MVRGRSIKDWVRRDVRLTDIYPDRNEDIRGMCVVELKVKVVSHRLYGLSKLRVD